jgi:hypothetical protein
VVQERARGAYRRFAADPSHPGLHFKRLHTSLPLWSARISEGYRAVGILNDDEVVWFFIGTHADYDHLLKSLG